MSLLLLKCAGSQLRTISAHAEQLVWWARGWRNWSFTTGRENSIKCRLTRTSPFLRKLLKVQLLEAKARLYSTSLQILNPRAKRRVRLPYLNLWLPPNLASKEANKWSLRKLLTKHLPVTPSIKILYGIKGSLKPKSTRNNRMEWRTTW